LKQLENELFGSQWSEYEKAFQEIEKELEAHEKEAGALQKKRQAAEEAQKEVEASQPKEREELQLIKKNINQILENRGALQKDLGRLEAQLESLQKMGGEEQLAVPVETLTRSLKKVEALLRDALKKDTASAHKILEEALREIETVFAPAKKQASQAPQVTAVKIEFNQLERDLKELEVSLQELKEREVTLEKNQAHFYEAFKSAVRAVEHAKDEIEKWENQHQAKRFEKERLLLRRTELERQMQQAGRTPQEFQAKRSGGALPTYEIANLEKRIFKLRGDLASIGEIDEALVREAKETETRYEFLSREAADLEKAQTDLRQLSKDLTEKIRVEFDEALHKINKEFATLFTLMFGGGQAKLYVQRRVVQPKKKESRDEDAVVEEEPKSEMSVEEEQEQEEKEGGIEIEVKLPRKKVSSLEMLSGGERSLVGIAALFALISVSPPPFLVLDEIDAALDERNARRFAGMLKEFSKKTQFLVVTHNRATMESANVLYGVTLNKDGTSKVLSLKLE
jgi:chromosome segregation protein